LSLFLSYKNENIKNTKPIIGYEYSLFARIWDVENFISQIIIIPFNNYIFGIFEENYFINHYSDFIPKGIKPMIIQKESKNIEGFIEEGKKLFAFI